MTQLLGETKTISVPKFYPKTGSLAAISTDRKNQLTINRNGWQECRETFHTNNPTMDFFLFCHEPNRTNAIAAFVHYYEKKLGHKKLSEFGPCNLNRMTWIKPAEFWKKSSIRRGLFTILLRATAEFDLSQQNFDEALYHSKYIRSTRKALDLFLEGNTMYRGPDGQNWCAAFERTSPSILPTILNRPLRRIPDKNLLLFALTKFKLSREQLVEEYKRSKKPKPKPKKGASSTPAEMPPPQRARRRGKVSA
jgi:hypothetical protein